MKTVTESKRGNLEPTIDADDVGQQPGPDLDLTRIKGVDVEDPLVKFLEKKWRGLLAFTLAVLLGIYVWNTLQETTQLRNQQYGDAFMALRQDFAAYKLKREELTKKEQELLAACAGKLECKGQEEQAKQHAETKAALADLSGKLKERLLVLEDSEGVYRHLGAVYSALIKIEDGDREGGLVSLKALRAENPESLSESERMLEDLINKAISALEG